jgi:hypothetical protein
VANAGPYVNGIVIVIAIVIEAGPVRGDNGDNDADAEERAAPALQNPSLPMARNYIPLDAATMPRPATVYR